VLVLGESLLEALAPCVHGVDERIGVRAGQRDLAVLDAKRQRPASSVDGSFVRHSAGSLAEATDGLTYRRGSVTIGDVTSLQLPGSRAAST
jgi:hypothetical protein